MVSKLEIGDKFFLWLTEIDEETSRQVAAGGCPACGGPLHRGDYPRKPRGGLLGIAGEAFSKRISLCCGRAGCRKRATPPSVRFLGRRVYLGAAVMLASAMACLVAVAQVGADWQIPARTVHRWTQAWQQEFPKGRFYQEQQGRFIPPLAAKSLPASLMERLEGPGRVSRRCWSGRCASCRH